MRTNSTRSVSYHHFGWAFLSSARSRVAEGRPIELKTRFFDFPHRGETKNTLAIEFHEVGFDTTILGGLFQVAQKAGSTKVVQLRSKRVLSTFSFGAKRKNTLAIEFHKIRFIPPFWVGFPKQGKSRDDEGPLIVFKTRFFDFPHRTETTKHPCDRVPQGRVSYHHFGWAFPSSEKSWVDEGRPIAFKTRFFDFPHLGETKKHPCERIPRGRFHTTILGGLFQAAGEAGLPKVIQLS